MPDNQKTDLPDSDQSARPKHTYEEAEDDGPEIDGLQTSNKSGKHSSVEKLAAARPEFGARPGDHPVNGAFGGDPADPVTGRGSAPDTNQFRCEACGRYFNTASELSAHAGECRLAKAATASGRESLRRGDALNAPDDAEA